MSNITVLQLDSSSIQILMQLATQLHVNSKDTDSLSFLNRTRNLDEATKILEPALGTHASSIYTKFNPVLLLDNEALSVDNISSYLSFMVYSVSHKLFIPDSLDVSADKFNQDFTRCMSSMSLDVLHWLFGTYWTQYTADQDIISRIEYAVHYGVPIDFRDKSITKWAFVHRQRPLTEPRRKRRKLSKTERDSNPYLQGLSELQPSFSKLDRESRYQMLQFMARISQASYLQGFNKGLKSSITPLTLSGLKDKPEQYSQVVYGTMPHTAEEHFRLMYGDVLYSLGLRDLIDRPKLN